MLENYLNNQEPEQFIVTQGQIVCELLAKSTTHKREDLETISSIITGSELNKEEAYFSLSLLRQVYLQLGYLDSAFKIEPKLRALDPEKNPSIILADNNDGSSSASDPVVLTPKKSKYKNIVTKFPEYNDKRLLALRGNRELDNSPIPLVNQNVELITGYIFSLIGWLWYLPRLSRNLTLGVKHACSKTTGKDYFKRHWFDISNDLAWLTTGFTTFGLSSHWWSIAGAGAGGIHLTVALYAFDTLTAGWRAHKEIKKYNRLIKRIQQQIDNIETKLIFNKFGIEDHNPCFSPRFHRTLSQDTVASDTDLPQDKIEFLKNKQAKFRSYLQKLTCKKAFENRKQAVAVITTIGLVAGMGLAMSPLLPITFAGSSLVLATCAANSFAKKKYLTNREIRCSHDALELLHAKLKTYVTTNIDRFSQTETKLLKKLEKCDSNTKRDLLERTIAKRKAFEEIRTRLLEWQNCIARDPNTLNTILNDLAHISSLTINKRCQTTSSKQLSKILKPYQKATWRNSIEKSKQANNLFQKSATSLAKNHQEFSYKLLHEKLTWHVRHQISKLTNSKNKFRFFNYKQEQHDKKLSLYLDIQQQLLQCQNSENDLQHIFHELVIASSICRDKNIKPQSKKDLQFILKPFDISIKDSPETSLQIDVKLFLDDRLPLRGHPERVIIPCSTLN